jgi:hypothetical protein
MVRATQPNRSSRNGDRVAAKSRPSIDTGSQVDDGDVGVGADRQRAFPGGD